MGEDEEWVFEGQGQVMGEQGTGVEAQVRRLTGADGGQGTLFVSTAKDTQ